jgi:hypothetical protein
MNARTNAHLDAERSVLGATLLDPEAAQFALDSLTPDDFQHPAHRHIFAAMAELREVGDAVDEITVGARLGKLAKKQGATYAYVASLTEAIPTAVNVPHWARLVRDAAVARRIAIATARARSAALEGDVDGSMATLATIEDVAEARHGRRQRQARSRGIRPTWPKLAAEAYLGLAGAYVNAVSPHTEADPVAILVQLLVAFGNMVGRGPHFVAEADRHHTNEFAVLVGSSAKGRKGSSWGHVRRLCELVDPEWTSTRIRSGLSSGEGLVHAVRDAASPDEQRDDPRLLVLESEFASALAVGSREGNTLSATVRNAWDGVTLGNLTKNNPDRASTPHISIVGHITQDELQRRLKDVDIGNGFANRFLWICVRRSKSLPDGGRVDDRAVRGFSERLVRCVEHARTVERLGRDAAANELWRATYDRLSAPKLGILDALTCRAEPHVMRLSSLYALLDLSSTVRVEHLQAGLALWSYVEASCRHIFGERSGDPVADVILEALRDNPGGLTRTEVSGLFGRNKRASVLAAALDSLSSLGLAEYRRIKTGGAPKEVWQAAWAGSRPACDAAAPHAPARSKDLVSCVDGADSKVTVPGRSTHHVAH